MDQGTPFRQHYLEHLNIRTRGVENWVLAAPATLWKRVGLVFLVAVAFFVIAMYFIVQCEVGNCGSTNEAAGVISLILSLTVAAILVFFLVPGLLARWLHRHRRGDWEIDLGPRLDELERQYAHRVDAPPETRATRDLLEQTLAGDFLGERFAVRGNFLSGLGRMFFIPAIVLVVVGLGSGDGEVALVLAVIALPVAGAGFLCRSLAKKSHELAKKATDKHMTAVQEALTKRLELPAPSFSPYARGGKNPASSASR